MARLSTHVLDTSRGVPAAGVRIDLYRDGSLLTTAITNADGRAVLIREELEHGTYEMIFHAGEYLRTSDATPFLDLIPVRFGVANADVNYHVPLLLSPYGYSTYRGS